MKNGVSLSVLALVLMVTHADAQTVQSKANAYNLLYPLADIGVGQARFNQAFWDANRNQTNSIANGTSNVPFLVPFAAGSNGNGLTAQGLAILGAPYTRPNLNQLGDGFGSGLGPVFQSIAWWSNPNSNYDTTNATWGAVSRNVTNLIWFTGNWIRDDNGYARGQLASAGSNTPPYAPPANQYGNAYGYNSVSPPTLVLPDGSGATLTTGNTRGNPRPFQTLPLPQFGQGIPLFWGSNFNTGQITSNWQYLAGPYADNTNSSSYASGHASYAVYGGLLLGMLVPERFGEMNARGVENALGRVVLGAHWAVDMIGARTLAYFEMSQMFAGDPAYTGTTQRPIPNGNPTGGSGERVTVGTDTTPTYQQLFQAAYNDMRVSLTSACGTSITVCAQGDTSRFNNKANNRAFYEANLTLGLPTIYADQAAIRYDFKSDPITKNIAHLLQTRFPYLSFDQRADVITSTQYMPAAGNFLDNGSAFGRFSRVDFAAAAEGYASFDSDVSIMMDASRGSENPYWADDTWSNNISGVGGFTKNGTGIMRFLGANTYTGPTVVNGGALLVDGSITSRVTVNSGGLLGGSGSFGGGVINPGGVISPGNSPGTLTSNGDLTLQNGSVYLAEVDGAKADKILVNGHAIVNGATLILNTMSQPAYLVGRRFSVLSATEGVTGSFGGLTPLQNFSFLNASLSYDANNAFLGYNLTPFSVVARTINQRNVGNALTVGAYGPISGQGANILNTLFYGSYQSAQAIMTTVSGAGLPGVQTTAMEVGQMASSTVSDQIAFWRSGEDNDTMGVTLHEGDTQDRGRGFMSYAPVESGVTTKSPIKVHGPVAGFAAPSPSTRTYRAWGSMFGGGANFLADVNRGAPAANLGYYGGLLGVDYQIAPNALLGVALGGSTANFSAGSLATSGNLTGFHAGLYGSYAMGASYVAVNETFSAYSNQTNRTAGGYSFLPYESLSASFGSTEFRTRLEGGHSVMMGGLKATPFVAAEVAIYNNNGFSENSSLYAQSSLALKNNGQTMHSLPTFVGLRLANAYTLANGWRLAPIGSVAYVHEFFPQRQLTNILMSLPGQDFSVSGPRSTYNLVQTKIGAQLHLTNQFALFSDFQGEFSPVSQSYGGKVGMKYVW